MKNVIHQIERNEWLFISAFHQGFIAKLELVFVLAHENAFS